MENISCALFHTLDMIGYSSDIITMRRNYWQEYENTLNDPLDSVRIIVAGSKSEGISSFYQSDIDVMYISTTEICVTNLEARQNLPHMIVLQADTRYAPPGYTRLKLVTSNGLRLGKYIQESIFNSENQEIYLSSSLFSGKLKRDMQLKEVFGELSGPAFTSNDGRVSMDSVFAFNCYCPEILHTWASRPRQYNWPPADVIEDAASLLAQVVAIGCKGSESQWREWRFCFIQSELKLVHSLNETQLKLFILLKMVSKEILKKVCKEVTSYIMKNVTFWVSEMKPRDAFRKENLFTLLVEALNMLNSSIKENNLPYYMIPQRNLLAERLTDENRNALCRVIDELVREGPKLLFKIPKLRIALTLQALSPQLLVRYCAMRNAVEALYYLHYLLEENNGEDNESAGIVWNRMKDIAIPEWRMLRTRGISVANAFNVFKKFWQSEDYVGLVSGPVFQINLEEISIDIVPAFQCYCPEILQTWASRPRQYNWHPADVLEDAASQLAQVVPIGCKGSDSQWREWRFCFIPLLKLVSKV